MIDLALSNSTEDQIGDAADDAMRLAVFFGAVASDPDRFPVTGRMATAVKLAQRQAKGPAQRKSRRNGRKERQEKRQSFSKRRRKDRAEFTALYNAAQEAVEAERVEMEESYAEIRARLDAEPKYDITDAQGNVIIGGVPRSMVRAVTDPESVDEEGVPVVHDDPSWGLDAAERFGFSEAEKPQIILPGSAEALQVQLDRQQQS